MKPSYITSAGEEQFVCEEILPVAGTFDAAGMSRGEPGLPARFAWRKTEYRLAGVIRQWKTTGPCHGGSDEVYLRRHWYQVLTEPHAVMTIYCDRQAKDRRRPKRRWWVYSASSPPASGISPDSVRRSTAKAKPG